MVRLGGDRQGGVPQVELDRRLLQAGDLGQRDRPPLARGTGAEPRWTAPIRTKPLPAFRCRRISTARSTAAPSANPTRSRPLPAVRAAVPCWGSRVSRSQAVTSAACATRSAGGASVPGEADRSPQAA